MNSLVYGILGGVLLLCVFAGSLAAQNSAGTNPQRAQDSRSDPPPATTPATNPPASTTPDPQFTPDLPELPKRMFGMIPDFENTNDIPANHRPMTVSQKFVLALHQAFDISAHLGNAFQAALQQAADSQPHYGEGWTAYGKRFAAAEGDQISGSLLIYGALPSILHEDPRYFRKGRGSTIARMWYAANRTFVTPRDNGSSGFNNSEAFGQLISCAISTSYYPQQDRSVSHVFSNWGVNLGGNSAYNVLSEFYPDMKRALFQRHRRPVVRDATFEQHPNEPQSGR